MDEMTNVESQKKKLGRPPKTIERPEFVSTGGIKAKKLYDIILVNDHLNYVNDPEGFIWKNGVCRTSDPELVALAKERVKTNGWKVVEVRE